MGEWGIKGIKGMGNLGLGVLGGGGRLRRRRGQLAGELGQG